MPHSSGGGSHSGGSHSGGGRSSFSRSSGGGSHSGGLHSGFSRSSSGFSHSGGGYRSRSSSFGSPSRPPVRPAPPVRPMVSPASFDGARRYVYYRNHAPVYVYSNYGNTIKPERHLWRLLIYIPLIWILLSNFAQLFLPPSKLSADYPHKIVVEDSVGVIDDEEALTKALESFFEETGIAPAVITVPNDDWNHFYSSLSNYAYSLYVNRFSDERHWLIVYSQPKGATGANVDWHWEGIQGDETDSILTTDTVARFNFLLQKYLTADSRYTVGQAITRAFKEFTPAVMKAKDLTSEQLILDPLLIIGMIFLALFRSGLLHRKEKRPEELPQDAKVCDEKSNEITCEYCSGVYLSDAVRCPHCGAAKTAQR